MYHYCYSIFARTLSQAAVRENEFMLPVAERLIGFLAKKPDVRKLSDGGKYPDIDAKTAGLWFWGQKQIWFGIQQAAGDGKYYDDARNAMEAFINDHLHKTKLETICYDLYLPLSEVHTIEIETRNKIKESLDRKEYVDFLTHALLIALTQENCIEGKVEKRKAKSLKDEVSQIKFILESCHKPVVIIAPDHPTYKEINYVTALLEAYASDAKVKVISEEDLRSKDEYKGYRINFDKERKAYYQAESLREATRDSDVFNSSSLSFDGVKEEIENGVEDTYKAKYENGYKRLFAVTEKAVTIHLRSLLETKLKWVNREIKRGTVHVIMNDEGEGWVREDDGE